jgi:hypothetical protein
MTKLNLVTELKEVGLNNIQIGIFDYIWMLGCIFFIQWRLLLEQLSGFCCLNGTRKGSDSTLMIFQNATLLP